MTSFDPVCPICGKVDKVDKAEEIVAAIYSTVPNAKAIQVKWAGTTYYIPPHPNLFEGGIFSQFFAYKLPEQNIKLPSEKPAKLLPIVLKPVKPSPKIFLSLVPSLSAVLVFLFVLVFSLTNNIFILAMVSLLLLIGAIFSSILLLTMMRYTIATYKTSLNNFNLRQRNLEKAEKVWFNLFYCYRDEVVFTSNSAFVPLSALYDFLFKPD